MNEWTTGWAKSQRPWETTSTKTLRKDTFPFWFGEAMVYNKVGVNYCCFCFLSNSSPQPWRWIWSLKCVREHIFLDKAQIFRQKKGMVEDPQNLKLLMQRKKCVENCPLKMSVNSWAYSWIEWKKNKKN